MSDGTMYAGRIQDTASENFGPFPVQTDEEAMTAIERGIFEQRQALAAALADAAALREQLAEANTELAERLRRIHAWSNKQAKTWVENERNKAARATAEALALTNEEARGRAEAKANKLRADLTRMDCDWPDFEAMRAERDELRAAWATLIPPVPLPDSGFKNLAPGQIWATRYPLGPGDEQIGAVFRVDGRPDEDGCATAALLAVVGDLIFEGEVCDASTAIRHAALVGAFVASNPAIPDGTPTDRK